MNYLHDKLYISKLPQEERTELVLSSAYVNDFDCALEVLRSSPNVNRADVIAIAKHAMLLDCGVLKR